jgi:hypothetical protein
MANIARDGAPKKLAPLKIHDGMYHFTKNGILARGLSKSQSAIYDGGLPIDTLTTSAVEKRFYAEGQVQPVINHRSRTNGTQDASTILREASGIVDHNAPGAVKARRT